MKQQIAQFAIVISEGLQNLTSRKSHRWLQNLLIDAIKGEFGSVVCLTLIQLFHIMDVVLRHDSSQLLKNLGILQKKG